MGGMKALSLPLEALSINQIYDPEADTWSTGASMPDTRLGLAVAVVNDIVYAIGGSPGYGEMQYEPPTATTWQYIPIGYIPEFPFLAPLVFAVYTVAVVLVVYKRKLCKTQLLESEK
jgi:hypothetical protein